MTQIRWPAGSRSAPAGQGAARNRVAFSSRHTSAVGNHGLSEAACAATAIMPFSVSCVASAASARPRRWSGHPSGTGSVRARCRLANARPAGESADAVQVRTVAGDAGRGLAIARGCQQLPTCDAAGRHIGDEGNARGCPCQNPLGRSLTDPAHAPDFGMTCRDGAWNARDHPAGGSGNTYNNTAKKCSVLPASTNACHSAS